MIYKLTTSNEPIITPKIKSISLSAPAITCDELTVKEGLVVDRGNLICKNAVRVGGKVYVKGDLMAGSISAWEIEVTGVLTVDHDFWCRTTVKAQKIVCGHTLLAGSYIEADEIIVNPNFGIFAGIYLSIRLKDQVSVFSNERPLNILFGSWEKK
jgi:hypothetical protein